MYFDVCIGVHCTSFWSHAFLTITCIRETWMFPILDLIQISVLFIVAQYDYEKCMKMQEETLKYFQTISEGVQSTHTLLQVFPDISLC